MSNSVFNLSLFCINSLSPDMLFKGTVPHADDNRIGPCRVQQQRGSRDHQYQWQRGGSRALDLFIECKSLNPFPGRAGDRCWVPLAPSPPSGQPGQRPTTPLHRETPSPGKLPSRIDLGENLILASKSGSKVMDRAQDDRLEQV